MEKELNNTVTAVGNYNDVPTSITSAVSVVTMIDGLTITKSSDKQNWASGNLTYTITITNGAENAFETPTITDTLDPALIKLVADSVEVDGTKAEYNYSDTTGELSVVLGTIEVGAKSVITFQVQKV